MDLVPYLAKIAGLWTLSPSQLLRNLISRKSTARCQLFVSIFAFWYMSLSFPPLKVSIHTGMEVVHDDVNSRPRRIGKVSLSEYSRF